MNKVQDFVNKTQQQLTIKNTQNKRKKTNKQTL